MFELPARPIIARVTAAVTVGAALMLPAVACTLEEPAPSAAGSVCAPPDDRESAQNTQAAEACQQAMQTGKVALVGVGVVEPNTLHEVEVRSEAGLRAVSQRRITMDFVPMILPADEAPNLQDETCVNDHEAVRAAKRADTALHLAEYAIVVAVHALPSCGPKLGGAVVGGRYGFVFGVDSKVDKPSDYDAVAVTINHEMGHVMFKLGHEGRAVFKPEQGEPKVVWNSLTNPKTKAFDLRRLFEHCVVQDYADAGSSIMGYGFAHDQDINLFVTGAVSLPQLNPIHRQVTRWPDIVLQGEQASLERVLSQEWLAITPQGNAAGQYAALPLKTPIVLKTVVNGKQEDRAFSRLAYVPEGSQLRLYLVSADGFTVVSTSRTMPINTTGVRRDVIDGQTIELRNQSSDLQMRVVTSE